MTQNPDHQPQLAIPPETDWAFAPNPEQVERDQGVLEQLLKPPEQLKELSDLERSLLADTRFSFKFSQGSIFLQHKIMEYMRRQYPEIPPEGIDEAFENILPQLAAYEKFQPPHKHTPNLGLEGPVNADLRKRTIAREYVNITGDFAAIMKCESAAFGDNIGIENEAETPELHDLTHEQLLADIAAGILDRDLQYVKSGRPGRNTDTERFKSFYREYVIGQRRAPTTALSRMVKDLAEFMQQLEIKNAEDLQIDSSQYNRLVYKQKELATVWEYKNFGQQFIPDNSVEKTYDYEAHLKEFPGQIYELRQFAMNDLAKSDKLGGPLELKKAEIRAKLDQDPNFASMHGQLMQPSMLDIEALLDSQPLDEHTRQTLHKTLTEKLSSEIEQCDPQYIRDQPFRDYIKPVLEHKFKYELDREAQTERFQQAKKLSVSIGGTAITEPETKQPEMARPMHTSELQPSAPQNDLITKPGTQKTVQSFDNRAQAFALQAQLSGIPILGETKELEPQRPKTLLTPKKQRLIAEVDEPTKQLIIEPAEREL